MRGESESRTYDANKKTGGSNGSIRNEEEYSHGSNNASDLCEEVKVKRPMITYADLCKQIIFISETFTMGRIEALGRFGFTCFSVAPDHVQLVPKHEGECSVMLVLLWD